MIEEILLAFWGVWLLLILLAAFRVMGFSIARRRQDRRWKSGAGPRKPVALIVAVKGFDLQSTPRFFDSIFAQTYTDYRVIVCFESWTDPVAVWLCEHLELGPRRPVWTHPDPVSGPRSVTLVCGGISQNEGQKVRNQRAAFADLAARDAIVAFADADILCGEDWLVRLVAPINHGTHELSTTYRWLVPKRPTLPSQIASVINASITTQGGAAWCTFLWGGSMALARPVFDELDVPKLLEGSLNDDLRLSKAARATGRKIAFVRSLILPTPVDFTWKTFFEFARRQYTQVKFFSPILYTGINFVLGFYALGALSIVAALVYGYFFAWIPVAAAYVIDQFRSLVRQQIYLSLFPDNGIRQKLFAAAWLEHMLTPFWMMLHWLILVSTWTQNRITWAGIRYRIDSKSKTRILHRGGETVPLPAGAPGLAMLTALRDRRRGAVVPTVRATTAPAEPISTTVTLPSPEPEIETTLAPSDIMAPQEEVAASASPAAVPEIEVTGNLDAFEEAGERHRGPAFSPFSHSTRSSKGRSELRVFPTLRKTPARAGARARDSRPAAERLLAKSRLISVARPTDDLPSTRTSRNAEAAVSKSGGSPQSSSLFRQTVASSYRPRTAAERHLAGKSRATAGLPAVPVPTRPDKVKSLQHAARPRTALDRQRLRSAPSPKRRQGIVLPRSAAIPSPVQTSSRPPLLSVSPVKPPLRRGGHAGAARRATPGGRPSALLPGRCAPASSLRSVSGSCVGPRPFSRPVSRGPSSRP